jgi:Ni2+-binding GTPase involved in regulation of expression and maturation of urease and hydrogenase
MILSVPEGDDKAIKYPLMFSVCEALIVSKIDTLPNFDFNFDALRENVSHLNADIQIFPLSAKTDEGVDAFVEYIYNRVCSKKTSTTIL